MNSLVSNCVGTLLGTYAKLIQRTAPLYVAGSQHVQQAMRTGRPLIVASWHGQAHLLYGTLVSQMPANRYRMAVADDARLQLLSRFAINVGFDPTAVDVQGRDISGIRKLTRLMVRASSNGCLVIFPDGPDGPGRVPKQGVALLAQVTKALVIPIGGAANYAHSLRRWDHYKLPLPFDRIIAVYRPPLECTGGHDRDRFLDHLTTELNLAHEQAREMLSAGALDSAMRMKRFESGRTLAASSPIEDHYARRSPAHRDSELVGN